MLIPVDSKVYRLFSQLWWKILGLILLVYVFVMGLLIPLGPGVHNLSQNKMIAGKPTDIQIQAVNTHFLNSNTQLWLRADSQTFYTGQIQKILSDQELVVRFSAAQTAGAGINDGLDLIINNDKDGTFTLMDAVFIDTTSDSSAAQPTSIGAEAIRIQSDQARVMNFPNREILYESIRNLFFHVPMWFSMVFVLSFGFIASLLYLRKGDLKYDIYSSEAVKVSMLLGILGLATGMIWAKYTWGSFWPNDPKLNSVAVAMLIYVAYLLLRQSMTDEIRTARVSAVFNIFAFVMFNTLIFILPRLTASLHPGNGGNPTVGAYDLDNSMRMVFYPAVIAWTLIAFWVLSLKIRFKFASLVLDEEAST